MSPAHTAPHETLDVERTKLEDQQVELLGPLAEMLGRGNFTRQSVGATLFIEGERHVGMFVVLAGSIEITVPAPSTASSFPKAPASASPSSSGWAAR